MLSARVAVVGSAVLATASAIPMNAVNFEGGLRLTVNANPSGLQAQELLLDTGSSTLAFCDATLEDSLKALKTTYLSCNLYGSGNEGYWGWFYNGAVKLGSDITLDASYYSVMHQEVSMPCGSGLQGIFGVAFKQLDQAAVSSQPLNWPTGGVGSCPAPSTDLVGPLMHYLKQDTPEGRLGIYWSGAVGSNEGELYVGPTATSNSHYTSGTVQKAKLGELGYYDVTINEFAFGGNSYPVTCGSQAPCLVDTGTPIMMVPSEVYNAMSSGATGTLSIQLAGSGGSPVTLEFDAQTLIQNQYVAPFQQGEPYILGLPLWAFYYTVFNVDGLEMEFVQHNPAELLALRLQTAPSQTAPLVV